MRTLTQHFNSNDNNRTNLRNFEILQLRVWVLFHIHTPFPVGFGWHFLRMKPFPIVIVIVCFLFFHIWHHRVPFFHSLSVWQQLNNITLCSRCIIDRLYKYSWLLFVFAVFHNIFIFHLTTVHYVNQTPSSIYLFFFISFLFFYQYQYASASFDRIDQIPRIHFSLQNLFI